MEFKIGDTVNVGDWSLEINSTNILEQMEKDSKRFLFLGDFSDYFLRYAYLNNDHEEEDWYNDTKKYKILYIYKQYALIEEADCYNGKIYLIDVDGLQLTDKSFVIWTNGNISKDDIVDALSGYGIDDIIVEEGNL